MSIYDYTVIDNEGKEVNLGIYKGKVLCPTCREKEEETNGKIRKD